MVESFAPRFLNEPAVVAISESAVKLGYQDREVSKAIGLTIDVSGTLPDVVMVDLGSDPPLLVFVECVVTDGPVSERRKEDLEALAAGGGFQASDCAFVTVFRDRAEPVYRRMASSFAWGSFVWFASEPEHIVLLRHGSEEHSTSLAELLSET
ncbi:MAG: hypothetical protein GY719_13035 [bacterium]|nr:hypothetical protein [bacterium]